MTVGDGMPELSEEEEKRLALEMLLEAWDKAVARGVSPEALGTAAIYLTLSDMIDLYGEEPVAQMTETLPARVRNGEFTLKGE